MNGIIAIKLHTMDALVNILAEKYAAAFSMEEDALLQEVNEYTMQHHPHAHMLSGKEPLLVTVLCALQKDYSPVENYIPLS
jgi:oligoribonuclease (3'-5' exoribonuclease)